MIAGIYARKSMEQSGIADDPKSVSRQVAAARAFAARRGWTVDDAHAFTDAACRARNAPGGLGSAGSSSL